jgi:hypothetical protein
MNGGAYKPQKETVRLAYFREGSTHGDGINGGAYRLQEETVQLVYLREGSTHGDSMNSGVCRPAYFIWSCWSGFTGHGYLPCLALLVTL